MPAVTGRLTQTLLIQLGVVALYYLMGLCGFVMGGGVIGEQVPLIWPLSILMRALTSEDDREIAQCLIWLKTTHAGTGFMHESFDMNDPTHFTRPWFAWANSLYGELIIDLVRRKPSLMASKI